MNIEELAEAIAEARTEDAEISELKSYFYNVQVCSLENDFTKEELKKIYDDMKLSN